MESKTYKSCIVFQCKNTSFNSKKIFIFVPNNVRKRWLLLARRENSYSDNSTLYICEDHFDLPNDMLNYKEYKNNGSVSKVRLKFGCTPSKFDCLTKICHHPTIPVQRKIVKKPKKKVTIAECLKKVGEYSKNVKIISGHSSSSSTGLNCDLLVVGAKGSMDSILRPNRLKRFPKAMTDVPKRRPPPPAVTFESIIEELLQRSDIEQLNSANRLSEEPSVVKECRESSDLDSTCSDPSTAWAEVVPDDDMQMCRICFGTGNTLYLMTDGNNLGKAYEVLTGLTIENESDIPPYLCTECAHRLLNFNSFRTRSLRAHLILLETLKKNEYITMDSMNSIIGNQSLIGSSLSIVHKPLDQYDLEIKHEDEVYKSINEFDIEIKHEENENVSTNKQVDLTDQKTNSPNYITGRGIKSEKDISYYNSYKSEDVINDADLHSLHEVEIKMERMINKIVPNALAITILDENKVTSAVNVQQDEIMNLKMDRDAIKIIDDLVYCNRDTAINKLTERFSKKDKIANEEPICDVVTTNDDMPAACSTSTRTDSFNNKVKGHKNNIILGRDNLSLRRICR